MFEGHDGLDDPGDPRCGVRVADVGLHRAEQAEAASVGAPPERLRQRGDLDRIAERGRGAVRLDIGDGVGRDLGYRLRGADDLRLPLDARAR